jgi:hypothetical protein
MTYYGDFVTRSIENLLRSSVLLTPKKICFIDALKSTTLVAVNSRVELT